MHHPALSEHVATATADAMRAWSDVLSAWRTLATATEPAAVSDGWMAVMTATGQAQAASVHAATYAMRWRMTPTPFGVTGAFSSASPSETSSAPKPAPTAQNVVKDATKAATRSFQALAKPLGRADDLTCIKGVGPKMQEKLNAIGVFHFWQLASLAPAGAEMLDATLVANGRVKRDKWVAQAKRLAEDVPA